MSCILQQLFVSVESPLVHLCFSLPQSAMQMCAQFFLRSLASAHNCTLSAPGVPRISMQLTLLLFSSQEVQAPCSESGAGAPGIVP